MHEADGTDSIGEMLGLPEERGSQAEVPVREEHSQDEADSGVHTSGEAGASGHSGAGILPEQQRGAMAEQSEANQETSGLRDLIPYEEDGHPYPIVNFKGKRFYAIERYGNYKHKPYTEYREIGAPLQGTGVIPDITPESSSELLELKHSSLRERKNKRREEYEESVYGALRDVADLQTRILKLALDDDKHMSHEEVAKAKLGLAAAESVLNRALGKPVTKVDAELTVSVADEMYDIAEGWVVDEEED